MIVKEIGSTSIDTIKVLCVTTSALMFMVMLNLIHWEVSFTSQYRICTVSLVEWAMRMVSILWDYYISLTNLILQYNTKTQHMTSNYYEQGK
jgi:hypothetical protein